MSSMLQEHPGSGTTALSSGPDSSTCVTLTLSSSSRRQGGQAGRTPLPATQGGCADSMAKASQVSDPKEGCSSKASFHPFPSEVCTYDDFLCR